eukprot:gene35993-44389_t
MDDLRGIFPEPPTATATAIVSNNTNNQQGQKRKLTTEEGSPHNMTSVHRKPAERSVSSTLPVPHEENSSPQDDIASRTSSIVIDESSDEGDEDGDIKARERQIVHYQGYFDEKKTGYGEVRCFNGDEYVGPIKQGKFHGEGELTYDGGGVYTGTFREGKRHGVGTEIYRRSGSFVGTWKNDEYLLGKRMYHNGSSYDGEWRPDLDKHGQGTEITADGSKYVGQFQFNERHGYGELTSPNGDEYKGNFRKGQKSGYGRLQTAEELYDGEWSKDKKHGRCTVTDKDKNVFKGTYAKGQASGPGTKTLFKDKRVLRGSWLKGNREGEFVIENLDSETQHVCHYVRGKVHGEYKKFDSNGVVVSTTLFVDNKVVR